MWTSASDSTTTSQAAALAISLLADSTIKAAILLALVAAVLSVLKRFSAAARHLAWFLSLAVILVLPILALVIPTWNLLPNWSALPAGRADSITSPIAHQPSSAVALSKSPVESSVPEPGFPSVDRQSGQISSPRESRLLIPLPTWSDAAPFLIAIWLAGCLLAAAPWLLGTVSLQLLQRRAARVENGWLLARLHQLCARLGIRQRVQLMVSGQREMPMQWGVISPKILLPSSALKWPEDLLTSVLTHELSHVKRRDCLTQFFTTIVAACYWFHPMVWWAVRQMKAESEIACDDLTIRSGCGAAEYAEHVLYVAANSRTPRLTPQVAIGIARTSRLEERVRAILDSRRNRRPLLMSGFTACFALVFTIAAPLVLLGEKSPASVKDAELVFHDDANRESKSASAPADALIRLGYVDDSAEGKRSIGGSGHAVVFRRPGAAKYLMSIEIFASRYGTPEPPDEDFHVYLMDENQVLLQAYPFAYSTIERGADRWYTLKVPACEVPERFTVALSFNPHRTKGVYLGLDKNVKRSHSFTGRPTTGYRPITENYDWMVRAILVRQIPSVSPFADANSG